MIEYSKNYRKTTGSLWNYCRNERNNPPVNNYNADPITNCASFKYKSSIIEKALNNDNDDNITKNVETVVPLKYLSNFKRTLDILLINCELNLILTWSENCILKDNCIFTQAAVPAQADNRARLALNAPTNATFKITDTKLFWRVVTLSVQGNNNLLEQLKARFKKKLSNWINTE